MIKNNKHPTPESFGLTPIKDYKKLLAISLVPQNTITKMPDIVFEIENIPTLTKKSISLLIAKPKAGKTTTAVWIAAQAIKQSIKIAWIDTEQGEHYASRTQEWILKIIDLNTCEHLKYYDFKLYNTDDRIKLIDEVILKDQPEIIVIDGIRDLAFDINSPHEATQIITKLMQWADINNCHILCILHQNKGNEQARGHLGSELVNKAEAIIKVTKNTRNQIIVEPEYTRGNPFKAFALERDINGIPKLCEEYLTKFETKKTGISLFDYQDEKHTEVIEFVFKEKTNLTYNEVQTKVQIAFSTLGESFGVNKAKKIVSHYCSEGYILKNETIKGYSKYQSGLT